MQFVPDRIVGNRTIQVVSIRPFPGSSGLYIQSGDPLLAATCRIRSSITDNHSVAPGIDRRCRFDSDGDELPLRSIVLLRVGGLRETALALGIGIVRVPRIVHTKGGREMA